MGNTIKNTPFWLTLIFICVSSSKCRTIEDPPQEDLGLLTLGEAKDYLLFKPGSWWVYKNSYTNEIDTMLLDYCFIDTFHAENEKKKFDYEDIMYGIHSLRDKAFYRTFSRGMSAEPVPFSARWNYECKRFGGYNSKEGLTGHFFYPFDINYVLGNGVYHTRVSPR